MKRPRLTSQIIGAFSLGFISALVTIFFWFKAPPQSRLTEDLSADWKLASAQFDARVRTRFPIGTPVRVLADELQEEGFMPAWLDDQGGYDEHVAERVTADLACSYSARVRWRLSKHGEVSSIRGLRRMTCF